MTGSKKVLSQLGALSAAAAAVISWIAGPL